MIVLRNLAVSCNFFMLPRFGPLADMIEVMLAELAAEKRACTKSPKYGNLLQRAALTPVWTWTDFEGRLWMPGPPSF